MIFTPEEMVKEQHKYSDACDMLLESIAKGVAATTISVPNPRELLLSGRLTRIPEMLDLFKVKLSRFGEVRLVRRQAKITKEAAEGAYIIEEGLLGGKYKGIVDSLQLKGARGTMFDHIYLKGLL